MIGFSSPRYLNTIWKIVDFRIRVTNLNPELAKQFSKFLAPELVTEIKYIIL